MLNLTQLELPAQTQLMFAAKQDKTDLSQLATDNNMFVRASVTKHLNILCYGYNAGPKKLEQAMAKGVFILNRSQFENLIETGEVPEEV